jgi:hypothetical protein
MKLIDDRFRYTDADHAHYQQEGYHVFDRFLSPEGLAFCRRHVDRMMDNLQPGRDPADILSAHQQEPWMFDLAREPKALDVIEKQIGPNIMLWSSHMICKAPGTGTTVPWHQDAPYWNVKGTLPAGLWIAFDDMGADNGAMAVLPGWHRKGTLPRCDSGQDRFDEMVDPAALPANVEDLAAQYSMPASGMAIHDTMIPHRSQANTSDRWRRVLVLRYLDAEAQMGDKMYEDYRTGEPFARIGYLLRGEDVANRGWQRSPFQAA